MKKQLVVTALIALAFTLASCGSSKGCNGGGGYPKSHSTVSFNTDSQATTQQANA